MIAYKHCRTNIFCSKGNGLSAQNIQLCPKGMSYRIELKKGHQSLIYRSQNCFILFLFSNRPLRKFWLLGQEVWPKLQRDLAQNPTTELSITVRRLGTRFAFGYIGTRPPVRPSAWSSPSYLGKKKTRNFSQRVVPHAHLRGVVGASVKSFGTPLNANGRDLPQGVEPHAHRGVVGAPELCR